MLLACSEKYGFISTGFYPLAILPLRYLQDVLEHLLPVLVRERRPTGQHLVYQHSLLIV